MINSDKSNFETPTLSLAATIICFGFPLDSIEKNEDGKAVFIFSRANASDLDQIIQSFWQRTLKVEPNSFWEVVRFLKSRIYGGKNG